MSARRKLVISISSLIGIPAAIIACTIVFSRTAEVFNWGNRIGVVERATQNLSQGQLEIGRRVDSMSADVTALRKEFVQGSDRADRGQQGIMTELAKINGTLSGISEQAARNSEKLAQVQEKAANALVKVDAVEQRLMEHQLNAGKEKDTK